MKRDIRTELLSELDTLRPLEELVKSKGFQEYRAHIEKELKKLEDWSWNPVLTSNPIDLSKAFSELGLTTPKSVDELRECWLSFRAARNYQKAKFMWLDKQMKKVARIQEDLAKLDRGSVKSGG